MSNNGNKDWFYWVVNNIDSLPDLGIEEGDLNQCIKGTKVGLVKSPENNTDYTKAGFKLTFELLAWFMSYEYRH